MSNIKAQMSIQIQNQNQNIKKRIEIIRHSLSHLMSMAIMEKYPKAGLGVGPAIENGFYQDYDLPEALSEKDFGWIEKRVRNLIAKKIKFVKSESDIASALKFYEHDPYKTEIINDLKTAGEEKLIFYDSDWFHNLCAGPHVTDTSEINPDAFKLTKFAGSYWKGNEKNKMLTRIYGVAFATKKELDDYLALLAEAEKKDHRVLGEKMGLFMFDEKIGKGLPLWLPKGYFIRRILEDYMYQKEKEQGYLHVLTPILAKEDLYKTSGHLAHYKDDMYSPIEIEGEKYYLKPMNCPHHHAIFQNRLRSYRDLPLKIAEFGNVYRYERSGVLSGLIRARGFTQNDAHIYATPETLEKEIIGMLKLFKKVYGDFKIKDYWFRLSLPDFGNKEKYGDIENKKIWEGGTVVLRNVLKGLKLKFEEAAGEASFYGPKIDVQIKNIFFKEDTIATIQVDYYSASKFDLAYIDKEGQRKPPVIIHRAILGSFERFFAFLLEKTGGELPLWLSPEQIWIIPITDKHVKYAKNIGKELSANGLRVNVRDGNETVSKKIREGEIQKIPYLLVVGDKEMKTKSAAVRQRGKGDLGQMKLRKFVEKVKMEEENKK